jgi:topoisomerase-4 subunit A
MTTANEPTGDIRNAPLAEALGERYLSYALSTIMSRSLPDVRDGLKPVHRRLLFAMLKLKLDPKSGFKKCARVVGDVIGKYHPHGDVAVYDAMVRLAQYFAVRYPLVDGQGNFGSIDGDNAAAMRYTEARLTEAALALMKGIDEDTVDFVETYDGEESEPSVFPASYPNLLANGAAGIAVGMATNIPPHNIAELCRAALHLIKFPNAGFEKLMEFIPGPDFPTGGVLVESPEAILEAYKIGKGGFRLRAKWEVEKLPRGLYQIVVTEIPYQVQKSKLIEKIAELLNAKKLPILADVRDESTTEVRLILEPKTRTIDPEMLMEQLFRQSDLETRVSLNMNVLDAGQTPRVMNIREVLNAFLAHRMDVLERRSRHRLQKIEHRIEILGGMLIAFLNLDEVIRIIRETDEPKAELIKAFKLSDVQAEAVLNMRLRQLRKLEEMEIQQENDRLNEEMSGLKALLGNEEQRWSVISDEISATGKQFGSKTELGKRRTLIGDAPTAVVVPLEAMIEREPITVVCSEKGWIRAVRGHVGDPADMKYKDGDKEKFFFHAQTTDKLIVFATNGRFYTIGCGKLPGGRGHGEPLRLSIDLPNDSEFIEIFVHDSERRLVVVSDRGRGFIVEEKEIIAQTRNGKQVLNLGGDEEAAVCKFVRPEADSIAIIGENRKLLIFALDDLPVMSRGRGVILQRYKDGGLSDIQTFKLADGLTWQAGVGRMRTETDLLRWTGKRAQAGHMPPTGFARTNKFS